MALLGPLTQEVCPPQSHSTHSCPPQTLSLNWSISASENGSSSLPCPEHRQVAPLDAWPPGRARFRKGSSSQPLRQGRERGWVHAKADSGPACVPGGRGECVMRP